MAQDQVFTPERIPDSKRPRVNYVGAEHHAVRRLIVESAKHLFARFGYEGTTIGAIAHGAGISPEEVGMHFEDKLSILIAIFEEGWASLNRRLQDTIIDSVNARQAALSMFAVMMRVLDRDEDLARLFMFENRRPDPKTGEIVLSRGYRWFVRLCTDLVVRGQKDGSFRAALSPRLIASMLIGAMENLMRDRLIEQGEGTTLLSAAQLLSAFDSLISYLSPVKGQS